MICCNTRYKYVLKSHKSLQSVLRVGVIRFSAIWSTSRVSVIKFVPRVSSDKFEVVVANSANKTRALSLWETVCCSPTDTGILI